MLTDGPGIVVLLGSGETAASAQAVYHAVMTRYSPPVQVAVLETPAGFELNSDRVAGKVADYVREHLQNFRPQLSVIPARQRGTPYSPDEVSLLEPLLQANVIFFGPGSPTYAVRQLRGSLAWQMIRARHRLGAALVMASAATVAISAQAIPVYEIYKVGEDVHWQPGLNFFGEHGLNLVFVPHWDNNEGGSEVDTSRCWMGVKRFGILRSMLSADSVVVGIDEHTALFVDCQSNLCRVMGRGGVTLLREDTETRWTDGQEFSLESLGRCLTPPLGQGIAPPVWSSAVQAQAAVQAEPTPSEVVMALVREREDARARRDWQAADSLRGRIQALGWQVKDTPEGPQLTPA
jgi:cyanophycinase-like exopeptidase